MRLQSEVYKNNAESSVLIVRVRVSRTPDDETGTGRYKADPHGFSCYRACTSGEAYVLQTPLRVAVRYDNVRAKGSHTTRFFESLSISVVKCILIECSDVSAVRARRL